MIIRLFNVIYLTNFANIKSMLCDNHGLWRVDYVTSAKHNRLRSLPCVELTVSLAPKMFMWRHVHSWRHYTGIGQTDLQRDERTELGNEYRILHVHHTDAGKNCIFDLYFEYKLQISELSAHLCDTNMTKLQPNSCCIKFCIAVFHKVVCSQW